MKSWASFFTALALITAVFCSYALYKELTARIDRKGGEAIGTISFKKKSASRRYTENVIWEEVEQESKIYNYDAIRTAEYSSAVLSLNDGTKIELDQNTMLVVIMSDKGLNINFDKGGIYAKSGSEAVKPITINSRNASIAMDNGEIALNNTEKAMDIVVTSGQAKVSSGGKNVEITPDLVATLKDNVVESKKGSLFPKSPQNNSNIVSFGKTVPINFSWTSEPEGEVLIEIADSSDFKNIVKSLNAKKSDYRIDLPSGDYYWRISRNNAKSNLQRFTILTDTKPEPTSPRINEKLTTVTGSEMVSFRWSKSQYASSYEITAARDAKMNDVALKLTSRVNTISTPDLKPGTYYWTIKPVYPSEILSSSINTEPTRFTLENKQFSTLKPVLLERPAITVGSPFDLKWNGILGAKSYLVEIAADSEFKKIVLNKNATNTFSLVEEKLSEGRYYWRVSALAEDKSAAISLPAIFMITKPMPIEAVFPKSGNILTNNPQRIKYEWFDPNNGNNYTVEISDRSDFKNIKETLKSTDTKINGNSAGPGTYFWRIILNDESGKTVARSAVNEYTVPVELASPELVLPKNNEKVQPDTQKKITLQWKPAPTANEYEIEVFLRVAGTEKPIMIYTSEYPKIEISNLSIYRPGEYSWIVKAKRVKNGKLIAYKESKKSLFEIERVDLLPPPEVKKPGVLFN